MEKVYTLKELNEMREATIIAAKEVLNKKVVKSSSYTAAELSAMCGELLSAGSIAGRIGYYGFRISSGKVLVAKGRKCQKMAYLDDDGNIIKTFERKGATTYGIN